MKSQELIGSIGLIKVCGVKVRNHGYHTASSLNLESLLIL